ncbi:MAG: PAS domain-containing protein [Candidatus Manganitrophus sp. SA1]|nr:PAS domain-containing protein [Candidatus Manganitrophus morganii]
MLETLILTISIILQFVAVFLALRLIRITGRRSGWVLIAAAISLIAFRLLFTLFNFLSGKEALPALLNEWVALSTSALIAFGIAAIIPLFLSMKRSEEGLRKNEERFRSYFELGLIGMAITSPTKGILEVNDKICEILGYDRNELVKRTWAELTHPDDLAADVALFNRVIAGEIDGYTVDKRWIRKDSRVIDTTISVKCLRRPDGSVDHFVALLQDITERKRAEEALRESEERLRLALEAAQMGTFDWDIPRNRITWSRGHEKLWGLAPGEFGGTYEAFSERVHAEDLPGIEAEISRTLAAREPWAGEFRVVWPDGSIHWVLGRGEFTFDQNGKARRMRGVIMETTARRQAEEALHASRELLNNIIDSSPSYIFAQDLQHRIILANDALARLFEISKKEILGKTEQDVFPKQIADRLQAANRKIMKTGTALELEEIVAGRSGGEPRVVMTVKFPLRDRQGKVYGVGGVATDITERKQAEEALRKSEERLRFVTLATHDAVWDWDLATNTIWWNETFKETFRYKTEEIKPGFEFWESLIHPEDRQPLLSDLQATIDKGEQFLAAEYRLRRGDGRYANVLDRGHVIRDQKGRPVRMVGAIMDITDRKQAEQALQEAEARLRLALQAGRIGTWDWNMTTGKIVWSRGHEELWGMAPGAFRGTYEEFEGRLHPEDREGVNRVLVQAAAGRRAARNEFRVVWPDGSVHWIAGRGEPFYDDAGRPVRMIGVVMDITERKQAEEALRKSEERFQLASRATNDAIWDWDLVTNAVRWNERFQTLFGYQPEEIESGVESWTNRIHPEDKGWILSEVDAAIKQGHQFWSGEYRFRRGDGRYVAVFDRGYIVHDENGRPVRMIGAMLDITDRKRAEEEIKKLNLDLERRVAERTAQLEATNKELESFSYSVSHDLRAPLRGISGFSRVLLLRYADRLDPEGKDFLQRVDAASRRMGELIEDLLNLSRVTRSEIRKKPVDLTLLARSIAEDLQSSDPKRRVTFLIQEGLKASADPHLLRIVLENLLGNAWKFTSKHPTAAIELGRIEKNGKPVYFVRDDGAGFDMAYADKLFGAFQRLHSLNEFAGTGVGLASVQRIIHRHGGKVWAEGEVEKGATFYFTL